MGKGKKRATQERGNEKGGVEVVFDDDTDGPWCPHGPMLLFQSPRGRFFACSCSRRSECIPNIPTDTWSSLATKKQNQKYRSLTPHFDKTQDWKAYLKASNNGKTEVTYCSTCDTVCPTSAERQHAAHDTTRVPAHAARTPSVWLPPLHRETTHAQYHFTQESTDVIVSFILDNGIKHVLCLGTPSLHEALLGRGARSLLLDLDNRYRHVSPPDLFLQYNMFNHHFFQPGDGEVFRGFVESAGESSICVVLDPPFGGRVEPLARTLRSIAAACPRAALEVVWVFPYFAEPHITNVMPRLHMHHYQVTYRNHGKLHGSRCPVRLFSSLPRASLRLHGAAGYRHCATCDEWVPSGVRHCAVCGACTGRDGRPYVHCLPCGRCVKPTYRHCEECARCCLPGHECGKAPPVRSCYNCNRHGHKRVDCPLLREDAAQKRKRKENKLYYQNQSSTVFLSKVSVQMIL